MPPAVQQGEHHRSERILLVEDEDFSRGMIGQLLAQSGFRFVTAVADGAAALDRLRGDVFDVVLLDLHLSDPGDRDRTDGIDVLRHLQDQERFKVRPLVIVLSSSDSVDEVIECFQFGADDFHHKPIERKLLTFRIDTLLETHRLRQRLAAELADARELQASMMGIDFPKVTADLPIEIYADMEPALEIGGDFYDCFTVTPDTVCFAVGDVSDKGIPAALFMARARSLLRSVVAPGGGADTDHTLDPGTILSRLNTLLCSANTRCMFVTLFLGLLSPRSGVLRYANGGHPHPFLLKGDGSVGRLEDGRGRPLGLRPDSGFSSGAAILDPGDGLFVFTDGIPDAVGSDDRPYSETRLASLLQTHINKHPRDLVAEVRADVAAFADRRPPYDDITALSLRLIPAPDLARRTET